MATIKIISRMRIVAASRVGKPFNSGFWKRATFKINRRAKNATVAIKAKTLKISINPMIKV